MVDVLFPSFSSALGRLEGRSSDSEVFFDRIKESLVGPDFLFLSSGAIVGY